MATDVTKVGKGVTNLKIEYRRIIHHHTRGERQLDMEIVTDLSELRRVAHNCAGSLLRYWIYPRSNPWQHRRNHK